jgi:hypothetical protein
MTSVSSIPSWQVWGERVVYAYELSRERARDKEREGGAYLPCSRSICTRCNSGCPNCSH